MTLLCEIRLSILSNEKSASVIWKYINLTKRSKKREEKTREQVLWFFPFDGSKKSNLFVF